jgi:membrane-associated phospholipid phosphatase
MRFISRLLTRLELFELLGLVASAIAATIFFAYASRLDHLVGQEGYHWRIFFTVTGIYVRFIPWALIFGGGGFALIVVWMRRKEDKMRRTGRPGAAVSIAKNPRVKNLSEQAEPRDGISRRLRYGIRVFLSYCVLLIVFRVVNFYVQVLHPGIMDAWAQNIDAHIFFGKQVSEWLEPISNKWLTHLLTGAYVSWFWLLFTTIALLLYRGKQAVKEYVFASLLAFYVGYVCYVLVPVIGPGYTMHYSVTLHDIAPVYTNDRLFIARDCFPSLHTAISVIMGIFVWRYQRKWSLFYIPWLTLIVFATLYLRFHYGIDDIAGTILGGLASYLSPPLVRMYERWKATRKRVSEDEGIRAPAVEFS